MKKFIKIFSCTIVVISFLMLFLNWVELTPETKNAAVDLYNAEINSGEDVKAFSDIRKDLRNTDISISSILGEEGNTSMDILYRQSGIRESLYAILDGGINVPEMSFISKTAGKIMDFAGTRLSATDIMPNSTGVALSVYSLVVLIVFILSILAAIGTFFARGWDRFEKYRKYDIAFFIIQLVLFVLAIIFANRANSMVSAFALTGITVWSILAVIFACPTLLLEKLPFAKIEEYTGRGTVANDTFNTVSNSFNETMGKLSYMMEETSQNVKWGRELKSNEEQLKCKYTELGKKYYEENFENPPEDHKEEFEAIDSQRREIKSIQSNIDIARNIVVCPGCGSRWSSGTKFCADCGSKLPVVAEEDKRVRMENRTVKSFCKHCGAKIEQDDVFCPACGESL